MKNKSSLALSLLLITTLSCSMFTKVVSGPKSEATSSSQDSSTIIPNPQSIPSAVPDAQNTVSSPNLELRAFLGKNEDTGNGLKTVTIMLDGKNASDHWYGYKLNDTLGLACAAMGGPTLVTKEGFTYKLAQCPAGSCGLNAMALQQLPLPPGAAFAWTDASDYDPQYPNWWGLLRFDIPQTATPKEITFNYEASGGPNGSTFGSVTTPVLSMDEFAPIKDALDLKFGLKVSKSGDGFDFDQLARLNIQVGSGQSDGTITVTFNTISLDKGYPLRVDIQSYLLYQDGVFCCAIPIMGLNSRWQSSDPSDVSYQQSWTVGPSQTKSFHTSVNMRNGKVWMITNVSIQESSPANNDAQVQRFVLQIP